MKIETVAISSLTPDPRNARLHEQGVPELAASLETFGQRKNLVVWHDVVISGNGLMLAAQSLDWEEIAIDRVPDDWPYEKAQAYALADNKTAELSAWDPIVLDEIRFELDASGWEMEDFGFDELRLGPIADKDPDAVPDIHQRAKSKLGDLYELGAHRLLCGDSTKPESYERVLGGGMADCMWTDPPYGVSYVGKTKAHPAGARSIVFGNVILEVGWSIHETLVWVKSSMALGHSDYHYRHEPIYYGWTPGEGRSGRGKHAGSKWYGGNAQTSVLEYDKPSRSENHPTMKPVALIEQCVKNSSRAGEIVLDPFGGSGSTLIACEMTGRQCRMIEVDPIYVDVVVKRWEDFTGLKATRTR